MEKPTFGRLFVGALLAGAAAAVVNIVYALAYGAATGVASTFTSPVAVAFSSFAPMLPAGLLWFGVSRFTGKSQLVMTVLAIVFGVLAIAFGFVQQTFPDGSPKPAGFQGLVQPMHVVVPAALVLLVPWWVRRGANRA